MEILSKCIDSGSGGLCRPLLAPEERSPRGSGIGARGRRRRLRVQKHARHVISVVPTNFYGGWRSLKRFFENRPKSPFLKINQ